MLLLLVVTATPTLALQGNGLQGDYYRGKNFEQKVFSRMDPLINFRWPKSPGEGLGEEDFSIRWKGKLRAPYEGEYRIDVFVNDGARLWIGGKLLIDAWRYEKGRTYSATIYLQANKYYDIKLEYFNGPRIAMVQFYWESPKDRVSLLGVELYTPKKIIPTKYFFPLLPSKIPIRVKSEPQEVLVTKPLKPSTPIAYSKPHTKTRPSIHEKVPKSNLKQSLLPAEKITGSSIKTIEAQGSRRPINPPIPTGGQNLFFTQSRYELLPASSLLLDSMVRLLHQYPQLHLIVKGYTDNVGDTRLNLALSENRATVVANYCIRKGIAANRLTIKGYGSSHPLADNHTEQGRVQNRRVELLLQTGLELP